MDPKRLHELLGELHAELKTATSLDEESRRMLQQVLDDVTSLGGPDGPGKDAGGATEQLREAALRLETEHPRLAGALGQLGDALAKLGI